MLLAVVLGVMDFIPIIGAGTVMVPWTAVLFALGSWERGLALLAVWGVICLFRRIVEPKVVGNQTGLHPLLSLFAIYVGMKIGGLLAMILAPGPSADAAEPVAGGHVPRHLAGPDLGRPGYGRPSFVKSRRRKFSTILKILWKSRGILWKFKKRRRKVKSFSMVISRNLHK